MPELPEVEISRENLTEWLRGRRLLGVAVPDPLTRRGQNEKTIRAAAEGKVVRAVRRRGKFLRLDLSPASLSPSSPSAVSLLSHLGMSGRWVRRDRGAPDPPAVRATLRIAGGRRVVFSDRRRFGHFSLCRPADDERLLRLGPEPLEAGFTGRRFSTLLAATRRPVKALLMDQDRIAGIGNIQAAEALWRAGVHPARPAASLGPEEAKSLHRAIRWTLRRTIREARDIEIVYLSEGAAGRRSAASRFRVYGREGESCASCGRERIQRMMIAGRSSFYCPRCQPAPGV